MQTKQGCYMQVDLFIDCFRKFNRYYSDLLSGFDQQLYGDFFSLIEDRVVTEIAANGSIRPSAISKQLNLNKSQLSKILTKLEQNNIIVRKPSENDKRAFDISLTAKGAQLQSQQVIKVQSGLKEILAPYSTNELVRIDQAMTTIQATLQQQHHITITKGGLADLGYIADLHCRVYTDTGYNETFQRYVFQGLSQYAADHLNGEIWIANIDNVRVGTISLVKTAADDWQVRWFVVDPSYQGHGIGKRLVQTMMAYVKDQQISSVYLWTISELEAARSLYARQGFTLISSKPNHEWKAETVTEEKWCYLNESK